MRRIGRVAELWRYPVSSVGGQSLPQLDVSPTGIEGDRRFALFDPASGLAAAPEREPRWRPALFLDAVRDESALLPQLRFPDGETFWLDDARLNHRLEAHFGFAARIGAYGGLDDGADMRFPIVSNRYAPAALHLVTTASLRALAKAGSLPPIDHRRFRPSVLIETDEDDGFIENAWIGHETTIGATVVTVTEPTRRCGLTIVAQPAVDEEPQVLRTIMRHNARNLGVYATVQAPVTLSVGDPVYAGI
ncbi:MOSC domain-containing protein [Rhizobium glycinendophyticum]|uniref:MOSC domain-containing protein n=1 Tax=Rhizobium glycinendophyticum TaxID=2589807 RepID=A0A504U3J0_9HYPH|nr:MOSC N-terminal beta barrel domain-containing protein [Rhizobium glycinendophyticum]TPP09508.1 MOSC domain-containing protein [Rhizobium glycinendophyticum]